MGPDASYVFLTKQQEDRPSSTGPSSTASLISVNGVSWQNFLKSTVVHAEMGHMSQTTPLSGMICHSFGKTCYNLSMYQI